MSPPRPRCRGWHQAHQGLVLRPDRWPSLRCPVVLMCPGVSTPRCSRPYSPGLFLVTSEHMKRCVGGESSTWPPATSVTAITRQLGDEDVPCPSSNYFKQP